MVSDVGVFGIVILFCCSCCYRFVDYLFSSVLDDIILFSWKFVLFLKGKLLRMCWYRLWRVLIGVRLSLVWVRCRCRWLCLVCVGLFC